MREVTYTVKLPEDLAGAVDTLVDRSGLPRSAVLRDLIEVGVRQALDDSVGFDQLASTTHNATAAAIQELMDLVYKAIDVWRGRR